MVNELDQQFCSDVLVVDDDSLLRIALMKYADDWFVSKYKTTPSLQRLQAAFDKVCDYHVQLLNLNK
ncbi:hypothetical protein BOW52_08535 [Solemya elarraichensis gill symbiont]|uniref:Uncharacterized protein n=2 Tax=Solemya elarraichensis gill symbiont TaxID=1918949 RepID=A0A1T2L043_9GAMM|nr:hypothetical protein BOW52_08535 [Solemya elarraichensis gill symbiont]